MASHRQRRSAQIISLEEYRARREREAFGETPEDPHRRIAGLREPADREAPLLLFDRDPPQRRY